MAGGILPPPKAKGTRPELEKLSPCVTVTYIPEDPFSIYRPFRSPMQADYSTAFFYSSGAFNVQTIAPPLVDQTPKIEDPTLGKYLAFNPATAPTDTVNVLPNLSAVEITQAIKDVLDSHIADKDVRVFSVVQVYSYMDALVRLARELSDFNPACVLFPLRGGKKPRELLDAMLNRRLVCEEFPFSFHGDTELADIYRKYLRGLLRDYLRKNDPLRLCVVDAGKGGHGSNKLAKMLRSIHEEIGGHWEVTFHILHERESPPTRFDTAANKSMPHLKIEVRTHVVDSLLVEDWDEGIGLSAIHAGRRMIYKTSTTPGAVYVVDEKGKGTLAVSDDACLAINKMISEFGTLRLLETAQRRADQDHLAEWKARFETDQTPA